MLITAGELLASLEALPHPQRMRRLAASAPDLAPGVLAELAEGSAYERRLAVTAAAVVGDTGVLTALLGSSDVPVRSAALRSLLRHGAPPVPLWGLLEDAPAAGRRLVYRVLRGRGPAVEEQVGQLLAPVRERFGDAEAAVLLPSADSETVRRWLPGLAHAVRGWSVLADRHGDVVLGWAGAALAGGDATERAEWWARHASTVLRAAPAHPVAVFDLLERYASATALPGFPYRYGALAAADQDRLLRLLVAPGRRSWLRRTCLPAGLLRRLREADLTELARALGSGRLAALLRAVPPARRGALYDAVVFDAYVDVAEPDAALMDVLPRRWQEREARRMLRLDHVRGDEAAVRRWTAYLPWAEALPPLVEATRAADAIDRATAYRLLTAAARRSGDPAAVRQLLDRLRRLRNEQDPVRAAALEGLADLAPLMTVDSVPDLTLLAVDAVQARDTSSVALGSLGRLAAAALRHHVDQPELIRWALETIDRLFGGHRLPALEPFDRTLRRGQEAQLFARLHSWLEAGMARGDFAALFAVTRALGRRAWNLPQLQELLRRGIDHGQVSSVVRQCVELWLDDPRGRDERAGHVLSVDSSTITLPQVWHTICARRTDLLDRVLIGRAPTGKFLADGVRWVPGYPAHVDRWLPRHHRAYARLLGAVAADAGTPTWQRAAAIAAAARVPDHGREIVLRYIDSPNVPLAEAALGALPWTRDPDETLPLLLRHADTDRARVALYAAGRAARFAAPSRLPALLGPVALGRGKVTSRKEALRLLAAFGPADVDELLLAAWRQPDQHRDVRTAVISGARRFLHRGGAWTILDEAVRGGREDMLAVLRAAPYTLAEPDRARYAGLVVAACHAADPIAARAGYRHLPAWLRWTPDVTDLLTSALTDLTDHQVWPAVPPVVTAVLDHPAGAATLDAVLTALVAADDADTTPHGPPHDRPARRRLDTVVTAATEWAARATPDIDRTGTRAAAHRLATRPDYVAQAAKLLAVLLRPDVPETDHLGELADLLADRPVLAASLGDRIRSPHPGVVLTRAATLVHRADAAAGLLATAMVKAGAEHAWTAPWRDLVTALRRHPAADVRDAANALRMVTT
ncbi:hypothetical protein [Micromonospora pattaloongensis]|uniref:hypothetical protein n=1 Tax=Micromonospora pattaloongensis TaxID=405436 RepID=UPI0011153957|nr:hypothetical protein [Micromonospora pattaloongensis]